MFFDRVVESRLVYGFVLVIKSTVMKCVLFAKLFNYLQNKTTNDVCEQFEPRSGLTDCKAWSGSKMFYTLMVFLKAFFN